MIQKMFFSCSIIKNFENIIFFCLKPYISGSDLPAFLKQNRQIGLDTQCFRLFRGTNLIKCP